MEFKVLAFVETVELTVVDGVQSLYVRFEAMPSRSVDFFENHPSNLFRLRAMRLPVYVVEYVGERQTFKQAFGRVPREGGWKRLQVGDHGLP